MKKEIKFILLFFILIVSFSIVNGQDFKHFTVERTERSTRTIIPNFDEKPFLDNMKGTLMPKNVTHYTKPDLEAKFPDLFNKVEKVLDENERLNFLYYYNENGEVFYGYFGCSEEVLKKVTDELLLKIYNTFKELKIEVDPTTINTGEKRYGILTMNFKGK